ncbi:MULTISPECIES: hypothetical protein [unclassified Brenneria]|uniref:hypothetical protein n=1 Tax=unclassified Brenneria TaxID=2634434 RepID=UPI0029C235E9|nr:MULTISPECIES: hypothetical protein [unclassified Brenneria]MDX5630938.1 hypothetical protein [Brenneria sp. L3-3Z]MDX5698019.1 hypothetical protein [Brenneria sp. L4-2C]
MANQIPDFYVGSAGPSVTMRSTAYRHMKYKEPDGSINKFVAQTLESKSAPVIYFGFGKYSAGSTARDKFQIASEWSDARMRGAFDTLQLYKDGKSTAFVPKWEGNSHPTKLEPFAKAYPQYGQGGEAQLHAVGKLSILIQLILSRIKLCILWKEKTQRQCFITY